MMDAKRKVWLCYIEDDEDDVVLLRSLLDELTLFSIELATFADPEEGIRHVLREEPDACLIDYRIGSYNGLQVMERLKAANSKVPMIMLTGQDDHVLDLKAMQIGATDYLVKAELQAHALERAILHALERDRSQREYAAMENRFRATFERASLGIAHVDLIGNWLMVNPAFCRMFGFEQEELGMLSVDKLSVPEQLEDYRNQVVQLLTGEIGSVNREHCFIHKSGERVWTQMSVARIDAPTGAPEYLALMLKDITLSRKADEQMRKLSSAIQQAADSIMITDLKGRIEYVNPAFEELTGYTSEEAVGQNPSLIKSGEHDDAYYQTLWKTILSGQPFRDVLVNRRRSGEIYYEEKVITPLKDETGRVTHFISTGSDITERMRTQERLRYLAQHDLLTDLPNRFLFNDRARQRMEQARRDGLQLPLLFMDLDRFKLVNDTLGHRMGDKLLVEVGRRLQAVLRASDTVARLGGDEFGIVLQPGEDAGDAGRVAEKVANALMQPYEIDGHEMVTGTSIGIALFPDDGESIDLLLRNADTAMYRAKQLKGSLYRFYTADLNTLTDRRMKMEVKLRQALDNDEFRLFYQPQLDLVSDRVIAAEALIRWQSRDFGMVSPADFIPILEETGLIWEAGAWVLRTACEQVRQWRRDYREDMRVAVNVSPRQLADPSFVDMVRSIVSEVGIPPEALELEITESCLLDDVDQATMALRELDAFGTPLAMDDFGTGFSSLSYLRRLPVQTLKIDRSFISDCTTDPDAAGLVRAIVAMGLELGMDVLAEGVETVAQLEFMKQYGCHVVQGYLISPPVAAEDAIGWLDARVKLSAMR